MDLLKILESLIDENKKYYLLSYDVTFDLLIKPNNIILYTKKHLMYTIKIINLKIEKISIENNAILINDFLCIKE